MYQRNVNLRIGGPVTPVVKQLMIINASIFIIQQILLLVIPGRLEGIFGLSYKGFFENRMIWQPFTYMFLHGGWMHIILNLIGLWMFAGELELLWGKRNFVKFYLLSGTGAGFFIAFMNYLSFQKFGESSVTIGASGAIYAILLAYGMLWPEREVWLYFVVPVKIKYLLIIFGLIEFFGTLSSGMGFGGNISHIGHLGGLITGFIIIKICNLRNISDRKKLKIKLNWFRKRKLRKKNNVINERIKAKQIIDDLLTKIAKSGMNSLTPDEKKQLEWARKHYYPSNDDVVH